MKYEVRMNGGYMNRFAKYSEAVELAARLRAQFAHARVEIIAL